MNDIPSYSPLSSQKTQGEGQPLLIVRANVPVKMWPLVEFIGSPGGNKIGIRILAETIRLSLSLSESAIMSAGEMRVGFIWIECGELPPSFVISESLALLQRLGLTDFFSILLLDRREHFFRPFHEGQYSGAGELVTIEKISELAAICRADHEQRLAYLQTTFANNLNR